MSSCFIDKLTFILRSVNDKASRHGVLQNKRVESKLIRPNQCGRTNISLAHWGALVNAIISLWQLGKWKDTGTGYLRTTMSAPGQCET